MEGALGFNDVQRVKEWRGRNPDRYKRYMKEFMKKKREKVRNDLPFTDINEVIIVVDDKLAEIEVEANKAVVDDKLAEIEAEANKAVVDLVNRQASDVEIAKRQVEGFVFGTKGFKRRRG